MNPVHVIHTRVYTKVDMAIGLAVDWKSCQATLLSITRPLHASQIGKGLQGVGSPVRQICVQPSTTAHILDWCGSRGVGSPVRLAGNFALNHSTTARILYRCGSMGWASNP